jgi:3-oxoadipate enol-lactonase
MIPILVREHDRGQMASAVVNDITLAYTDEGQGGPVVFVHGAWLSRGMWAGQIAAFSASYRVIAPDLRGHGDSGATDAPYSVAQFAGDVLGLLDALGIARCVVCGHSLGGMVAQYLAMHHADRIAGVILADTSYGTGTTLADRLGTQIARWMMAATPRLVIDSSARLYGKHNPATRAYLEQVMRQHLNGKANAVRITEAAFAWNAQADLPRIGAPTLVLVGGENRQTHAQGREMARLIPNAAFASIQGAGHLLNMDQPEAFNQAVGGFLARLPAWA